MLNTPFAPWPSYTQEEADAVARVLTSNRVNYWTGDECRNFESEFARWCGVSFAVSVANGTLALEAALRALDLSPGDEVVVTPRTFFASASSIVAVGAVPVFADVDRDSQNITAATVERVLTPRTRGILCVHLAGWPCEMDALTALASDRGIKTIEDCAQAHGARYRGRSVGALGTLAAWSFCQDKIMTTAGEGGMVTTHDELLWSRVWAVKDHGKDYDAVYRREHPPGFRWVHDSFGTNMRMLEMQAVVGRIQLHRMESWTRAREHNANRILTACRETRVLRVPVVPAHVQHGWYRAYAFVEPDALRSGWSRDRIMAEINQRGVPCLSGSCSEVYLERAFDGSTARPKERLPVARELGETSLMFLVHPTLSEAEIDKTADAIRAVAYAATR